MVTVKLLYNDKDGEYYFGYKCVFEPEIRDEVCETVTEFISQMIEKTLG